MIAIVAKHFVKEEKTQEFVCIAKKLIEETVSKDRGCLRYELFVDRNNPNVVAFFEEWEDLEAIEEHKGKEHFKELIAILIGFAAREREVTQYVKA